MHGVHMVVAVDVTPLIASGQLRISQIEAVGNSRAVVQLSGELQEEPTIGDIDLAVAVNVAPGVRCTCADDDADRSRGLVAVFVTGRQGDRVRAF